MAASDILVWPPLTAAASLLRYDRTSTRRWAEAFSLPSLSPQRHLATLCVSGVAGGEVKNGWQA